MNFMGCGTWTIFFSSRFFYYCCCRWFSMHDDQSPRIQSYIHKRIILHYILLYTIFHFFNIFIYIDKLDIYSRMFVRRKDKTGAGPSSLPTAGVPIAEQRRRTSNNIMKKKHKKKKVINKTYRRRYTQSITTCEMTSNLRKSYINIFKKNKTRYRTKKIKATLPCSFHVAWNVILRVSIRVVR